MEIRDDFIYPCLLIHTVVCTSYLQLSTDLLGQPDRPEERERVEAAGGRVLNWKGSPVLGGLATSRSIGM